MRKEFSKLLYKEMLNNKNIYLLTADLGYGLFDNFKKDFPKNFYNVGAAEQLLLGIGIGLAQENKIPICYSITPFLLCRPFEFIRNYLNHEEISVKLVGAGRNDDYKHDGFSHYAKDDEEILKPFPHIEIYKPKNIKELQTFFEHFLYSNKPSYLNLSRFHQSI